MKKGYDAAEAAENWEVFSNKMETMEKWIDRFFKFSGILVAAALLLKVIHFLIFGG